MLSETQRKKYHRERKDAEEINDEDDLAEEVLTNPEKLKGNGIGVGGDEVEGYPDGDADGNEIDVPHNEGDVDVDGYHLPRDHHDCLEGNPENLKEDGIGVSGDRVEGDPNGDANGNKVDLPRNEGGRQRSPTV